MKKLFLILAAVCSLALVSCKKDCVYTIHYTDTTTSFANVTVFEYNYNHDLLSKREIKNIDDKVYSFSSTLGADIICIGVEGIVGGRVIEWYSADTWTLDTHKSVDIEVNFTTMRTQNYNPVEEDDCITRYLNK